MRDAGSESRDGDSVMRVVESGSDPGSPIPDPDAGLIQLRAGSGRGASPSAARAIALMWSGIVPQQPPRMLTKPLAAKSCSNAPVSSGVSSYSPNAFGSPALG